MAGGLSEGPTRAGLPPNGAGNVESHANIAGRGFSPLQRACGLVDETGPPRHGLHSLRHLIASWVIEHRFSPKRLQALLGHSSIQTTPAAARTNAPRMAARAASDEKPFPPRDRSADALDRRLPGSFGTGKRR